MIILDVIGTYECQTCCDLARPREERCTSCRDWQDHGVLPTTLASAIEAAAECGEVAWREGDEVSDRVAREVGNRLLTLERRRDRLTPR